MTTTKRQSSKSQRKSASSRRPLESRPNEEIWREYRETKDEQIKNFLMVKYLDLVKHTAERMHSRLPGEVDVEDLMSAGLFGLMDAIDAFDFKRGVKFETYCTQRIRGAIFDELRMMDWVPRLVRSRIAKVDRARKALEVQFGRKPTEEEICSRLQISTEEFEKLLNDSRPVGVVSLHRKWFKTDSNKDVSEINVVEDVRQEDPLTEAQRKDLKTLIVKGLSRAERLIIILYYYEGMTMKEIGSTLDLSESRVSQMHSSILARLKAQMRHRGRVAIDDRSITSELQARPTPEIWRSIVGHDIAISRSVVARDLAILESEAASTSLMVHDAIAQGILASLTEATDSVGRAANHVGNCVQIAERVSTRFLEVMSRGTH